MWNVSLSFAYCQFFCKSSLVLNAMYPMLMQQITDYTMFKIPVQYFPYSTCSIHHVHSIVTSSHLHYRKKLPIVAHVAAWLAALDSSEIWLLCWNQYFWLSFSHQKLTAVSVSIAWQVLSLIFQKLEDHCDMDTESIPCAAVSEAKGILFHLTSVERSS